MPLYIYIYMYPAHRKNGSPNTMNKAGKILEFYKYNHVPVVWWYIVPVIINLGVQPEKYVAMYRLQVFQ